MQRLPVITQQDWSAFSVQHYSGGRPSSLETIDSLQSWSDIRGMNEVASIRQGCILRIKSVWG